MYNRIKREDQEVFVTLMKEEKRQAAEGMLGLVRAGRRCGTPRGTGGRDVEPRGKGRGALPLQPA